MQTILTTSYLKALVVLAVAASMAALLGNGTWH